MKVEPLCPGCGKEVDPKVFTGDGRTMQGWCRPCWEKPVVPPGFTLEIVRNILLGVNTREEEAVSKTNHAPLTAQELVEIRQMAESAEGDYYEGHWAEPAKRLLAEVERLRKELQEIADDPIAEHSDDMATWDCEGCKFKSKWARKALGGG